MRNRIRSLLHSTGNTNVTPSGPTPGSPSSSKWLSKVVAKKTKKKPNSLAAFPHTNTPLNESSDAVSVGNSNNSGRNAAGLSAPNQTGEEGLGDVRDALAIEADSIPESQPLAIDPEALKQLFTWQKENPDNRLTTVLRKVSTVMESEVFKAALKLIPRGSPVPVGAIVECVAAIVLVGIKTRERKKEALEFAMRVVGDLDALANALGASRPNEDPLWDQCTNDLQPFCDAVNEVCQWALEQLRSKLGLSTDELVTLEKKIENANASFGRLSTVRMLRALSNQSQDISRMLQFVERRIQLDRIRGDLGGQIADMYLYSEQGKQDCHPGTRGEALGMLDTWLWEHSTTAGDYLKRCWWITGVAGVGKTAIAISCIQYLVDRKRLTMHPGHNAEDETEPSEGWGRNDGPRTERDNQRANDPGTSNPSTPSSPIDAFHTQPPILAAQYFFNHKFPNSAELSRLFPTLALQLARVSPVAACILQKALTDEPSLANRFSFKQAEKLFLAPLCELCDLTPQQSVVIVIDGLDELSPLSGKGKEQCYGLVTNVLVRLAERLPPNAGLVILSRPETEFIDNISDHIHRHHLDTNAVESRDAVRRYFTDELPTICRDPGFPSNPQLAALCIAADGHLGWAKGAKSWLWSFFKTFPDPSLRDQAIVELAGLTPGDLPELYRHMLDGLLQRVDQSHRSAYGKNLRSVLSVLNILYEPQQIGAIRKLLPFDARGYLHDLSGVYADGTKPITDETIPQPHKSFYEFVVSERLKRDLPALHVDIPTAHRELASRCFEIMDSDLHFNMGHLQSLERMFNEAQKHAVSQIPGHVQYACTLFMHHIERCRYSFSEEATQWLRSANFLFWLEVILLRNGLSPAATMLQTLQDLYPEIQTLIEQSAGFVAGFSVAFENNPLLIYLVALPFSPSSFQPSCLTQHITIFKSRHNGWVRKRLPVPSKISHNGESLVIRSKDRLSLLSVGSDRPLWERIARADMPYLSCVAFSKDGKTIFVAGIKVGSSAVYVLPVDAMSGDVAKEVVLGTSRGVLMKGRIRISLSPTGAYITLKILRDWDLDLYLYQARGGPPLMTWIKHGLFTNCQWLSGEYLLVFEQDRGFIVKAQTQELVVSFDLSDRPAVTREQHSIAYDENRDVLALGLRGQIAVFKGLKQLTSGRNMKGTILKPEYFHVGGPFVSECCFSPDGKYLALCPGDQTIQLWSCTTWIHITTLHGLLDHFIDQLTFQRSGSRLVSRSWDGTIQIWDISAIVEGREHRVEVDEGVLAAGSWFKHGIQLGGMFLGGEEPEPFMFDYPFELPEGVERLNWKIEDSDDEEEWMKEK